MSDFVAGSSAKMREIKSDNGVFKTLKLSLCVEQLDKLKFKKGGNGKMYLNLDIVERKEVGQYGDTHSVKYDTWEPNKVGANMEDSSDLPF